MKADIVSGYFVLPDWRAPVESRPCPRGLVQASLSGTSRTQGMGRKTEGLDKAPVLTLNKSVV